MTLPSTAWRSGDPLTRRIFPRADAVWTDTNWKNWSRRFWRPAVAAAGFAGARPYDLRHSFVSLLIAEGRSVVDVARQAGHGAARSLETYGHVFAEFEDVPRVSADEAVRDARVPRMCPEAITADSAATVS